MNEASIPSPRPERDAAVPALQGTEAVQPPSDAPPVTGDDAAGPTAIPLAGWKHILARVWAALLGNALWANCGCVGFFGFLSIFPILAIFVLVYGLAFDPADIDGQIEQLRPFVPEMVFQLLDTRLRDLTSNSTQDLTLGLVLTVGVAMWTGSRGMNAMIDLLNVTYHEPDVRSFVRRAVTAIALTVLGLLALIVILITVAAIPVLTSNLPFTRLAETIALWGRWPLLAAMIFGGLCFLYRYGPNRRDARWRWVLPGALLGSILWMILSGLFSFYVERINDYGAMFGTLSVAVVMMLWVYYSALVVALGAIVNAEIELQTRVDSTVGPDRPRGQRGAVVADALPPATGKGAA